MKIDFNFTLKSLEGKDLKDPNGVILNAGEVLATALANGKFKKIDALKAWDKAKQIFSKQVVDLDASDQKAFKEVIQEELTLPSQIEAQILEAFDKKPTKQ